MLLDLPFNDDCRSCFTEPDSPRMKIIVLLLATVAAASAQQLQQSGSFSAQPGYEASFVFDATTGMVDFTVNAKVRQGHWAALGFSDDRRMENTDAVIAYFGTGATAATIWNARIVAKSQAGVIRDATRSVNLKSSNEADGTLTFTFSRMHDTQCRHFIFAWNGPVNNGRIFKHDSRGSSQMKVCIGSSPQIPVPPPVTAAPAQVINCNKPPQVNFGTHSFPNQPAFGVGSTVLYTCDNGYVLIGSRSATCIAGGTWQVQTPTTCLPLGTPSPAPVATAPPPPATAPPPPATTPVAAMTFPPQPAVVVTPVTLTRSRVNPCAGIQCPARSTCKVSVDGFAYCECDVGYQRNNIGTCLPVVPNTCGGRICPQFSTCMNGVCQCNVGYNMVNGICDRILNIVGPCFGVSCHEKARCVAREGIAYCVCNDGYRTINIGECVANAPCYDVKCKFREVCVEREGKGMCECVIGYRKRQGGNCLIIDPCTGVTCGQNSVCRNGACQCVDGYMPGGDGRCVLMRDPCFDIDCPDSSECTVMAGIPVCACVAGYFLNSDLMCAAIDRCAGITCLQFSTCLAGACVCNEGYSRPSPSALCAAIDPCAGVTCPQYSSCIAGTCRCNVGYTGNPTLACTAINPCAGVTCPQYSSCIAGTCRCNVGYTGNPTLACTAINPCTGVTCPLYSSCIAGSCRCNVGYTGNPTVACRPIATNACVGVTCPANSQCVGGTCRCITGYIPQGVACVRDLCNGINCPANSVCTAGICRCITGFNLGIDGGCYGTSNPTRQSCMSVCGRNIIGRCSCLASCRLLGTCCADYNFYCGFLQQLGVNVVLQR